MWTQPRHVFSYEDYLVKRFYRSGNVLNQYEDVKALASRGLNIDIGTHSSAYESITVVQVLAALCIMRFFVLRIYA